MRNPRSPHKLPDSVHRQLNSYALSASAAGVGVLALAPHADAKVVYTKTHELIHGRHASLNLDLNNDGIADFRFAIVSPGDKYFSYVTIYPLWSGGGSRNSVRADTFGAIAYPAGASIGPGKAGVRPPKSVYGIPMERGCYHESQGDCTGGNWLDAKNRYLGLVFRIDGEIHYGWARLSATLVHPPYNRVAARLTGYAYETIPNKAIITGKTHGPDVITVQGGSLGALAAGSSAHRK